MNKLSLWIYDLWNLSKLQKWYWKLQHRFNPKYQYNKITNLELEIGYHDPNIRLTQAIFILFCEWVETGKEQENIISHPWFDEVDEIYNYWKVERIRLQNTLDNYVDINDYEYYFKLEKDMDEKDKHYMKLIIDHIEMLWYP